MSKLITSLENALLLGCNVSFKKVMGVFFEIHVDKEKNNALVMLPMADHLNDENVSKYVDALVSEVTN